LQKPRFARLTPRRLILLALGAAVLFFVGCYPDGGGGPAPIVISPQVNAVAANTSVAFEVVSPDGAYDPRHATWNFFGDPTIQGSITPSTGAKVTYTAPATPPIYPTNFDPLMQGRVFLEANIAGAQTAAISFPITTSTVTTGLSPSTVTVPLGTTQQFYGYAVGAASNQVIWQLNGITEGSVELGTITTSGLYIAPEAPPPTGNSITLTLTSAADPTRQSTATITLD
jgi:hypothetical protein